MIAGLSAPTRSMTEPSVVDMTPAISAPIAHPIRDGADNRVTSAVEEDSPARAVTRPSRSGTMLEPSSRPVCRASAAAVSATNAPRDTSAGHQRFSS